MNNTYGMIIGVNTLSILPGQIGGGETYLTNLLKAWCQVDTPNTYYLFVNKANMGLFPSGGNFKHIICPVSKSNLIFRVIWEQLFLPFIVKIKRMNVLFSPANTAPLFMPFAFSVITIHDTNWKYFRPASSRLYEKVLSYLVSHSAQRADRIITDSEFSRDELMRNLRVDKEKINVIPLGQGQVFDFPDSVPNRCITNLLKKKYIFSVGTLHRHKNFINLIKAFHQLRQLPGMTDFRLIIAGMVGNQYAEILEIVKSGKLGGSILLFNNLDSADLRLIYKNAALFVCPSLYEGFGLPVLEAMSFGIPVVVSNRASLPEVVGDAAIKFDPINVPDIAEKMAMVLNSPELTRELVNRGYLRLKYFNWEKTASLTLKVFAEALKGKRGKY